MSTPGEQARARALLVGERSAQIKFKQAGSSSAQAALELDARLDDVDAGDAALEKIDHGLRRGRRGVAKLLQAREILKPGDTPPATGSTYRYEALGLPWEPEDIDDAFPFYVPAPAGEVSRSRLELTMGGTPENPGAQNLIAWLVARRKSGAGINSEMLAYLFWSLRRCTFRQGIGTRHGPSPVSKNAKGEWVGKTKDAAAPAVFGEIAGDLTNLIHVADYDTGEHWLEWNGRRTKSGEPLIFPEGKLTIGAHGILLALGGVPGNPSETSLLGVEFIAASVEITYRSATLAFQDVHE